MGIYTNQSISWERYLFFERTFLEYLRYVPLSSNNNDVWSYQLSDLIVNIGSVVDSFFRNLVSSKSLDTFQGIQTHRSNVKNLKIQEFHDIFNVQYGLSNKNVYELKNYVKLSPFDKWTHNGSPFWWTDYNKVKHNRFENRKQATLNSTLHALSALFLLNVASPELIPYLVDIGVIHKMG
ncbi:hypothetical protein [Methanolacinia petrolearia]|uniref:hypothetical protein n=1 Tax=Methanolacinia petrolearia TaxID=54120 RepID=UPI003BAD291B